MIGNYRDNIDNNYNNNNNDNNNSYYGMISINSFIFRSYHYINFDLEYPDDPDGYNSDNTDIWRYRFRITYL